MANVLGKDFSGHYPYLFDPAGTLCSFTDLDSGCRFDHRRTGTDFKRLFIYTENTEPGRL